MGLLVGVGGCILLPLEGDSEAERCWGRRVDVSGKGIRGVSEGKAWHVLEQRGQSGWRRGRVGEVSAGFRSC